MRNKARNVLWQLFRGAFRLALHLPGPLLLRISGQQRLTIEGRVLDPRVQFHAWLVRRFRTPVAPDPVEQRKPALLSIGLLEGRPLSMAALTDRSIPGPAGAMNVRIYHPHTAPAIAPILVYYHFGGCVIGDLETCHTACSMIAHHAGCIVVSADYRLAPEHKYPAALEDALAAYQWARDNALSLGGDPELVGVGGDSAGGYLSAAVSLAMLRDGHKPPCMQLLIYPVVEMDRTSMPATGFDTSYPLSRADMIWFAEHYLREPRDADDPMCSIGRAETLAGLPDTIVVLAGHDVLHDEGADFARRLVAEGVPTVLRSYDRLAHAFTAMSGGVPAARQAMIEIAELVGQTFKSHSKQSNNSETESNDDRRYAQ